ncbi:LuxR C-terminal-related transcriptional regulator [Nocardia sp. NBC_01327]|uniref:LuxR C-terminal-related transcriptional regulator n=1 Tax=Nocardia sp. NBC_01327 TaxID=2903593 RepID=UPI002E103F4A|nr:LuxR C-terminal-related transcriptional regulator [Nocardia sp. NBC_01327]
MIGNTPVALDSLPCTREIFRELDSDDPAPLLYLIRGRSGTGKSTLLTAIRNRLRARGIPLIEAAAIMSADPASTRHDPLRPDVSTEPIAGEPQSRNGSGTPADTVASTTRQTRNGSGTPTDAVTSATQQARNGSGSPAASIASTTRQTRNGSGTPTDAVTSATQQARNGSGSPAASIASAVPQARGGSGAAARSRVAVVVDDAHGLSPAEFDRLCAVAESGACTVVIATLPRPHDPRLRALAELVARRGRVVDLRALGATEIAPFARELGMMVPRGLAQHIHRQTAGIHGGVVAALTAACATRLDAGLSAVDDAVAGWARGRLDDADPDLLDTFVVAAIGAGLDTAELAEVLDVTPTAAQDLVDRARSSALVTDADLLLTPAIAPLRTLVGDRRVLAVQRRLLQARLDAGLLRDHTALLLAESGVRDPRLAEFLCATAEKAGDEAVRHYAAAATAGADLEAIALRWADAAARTGDCDTALRLAEPVLARPHAAPAELAAAVRICAGVWTRRGLANRAAQLYTWLGADRVGADWAVAATVLYLAGHAPTARALSTCSAHWPPTEATARTALIAEALADSVETLPPPAHFTADPTNRTYPTPADATQFAPAPQRPTAGFAPASHLPTAYAARGAADRGGEGVDRPALTGAARLTAMTHGSSELAPVPPRFTTRAGEAGRSAAVAAASALIHAAHSGVAPNENGGDRFLPCSAVSIATLLCLSMGEPRRAADALRGAGHDPQSLVLGAWVAMLGGDEQAAAAVVAGLDLAALDPRDRLLAHGVIVGLARRSGDHTALTLAWQQAYPLFDEVSADLLALLPIGELWLAGIRLRDEGRMTALVDAAGELLRVLGDPPAWSNAFHWYAIQAAIAHESPNDLVPHAHRLKAAAESGDSQAAALADAGRTWVLVLRGQVERVQVEAAVGRLAGLGLIWDAARLASEAALAADDPVTATALLKLARTLRTRARPPEVRAPAPAAPPPRPEPRTDTVLSEREREVAELVLLGLTYREIGARLYISAKTVEHHVARIRRRIGASSRSELLSMLRAMGHGSLLV